MPLAFKLEKIAQLRRDKEIREGRRITQQEVADAVGVHMNTIWRFENGQYQNPEPETVKRLAAFFGVLYEDFQVEVDDPPARTRPKNRAPHRALAYPGK